jgi:hypothetical protein
MSSDSEESRSSAPRNHQDESAQDDFADGASVDQNGSMEEDAPGDNGTEDEDAEEEELESIDHGGNALTFHRVRSRGAQQEEDTSSVLSIRSKVERPGSPESTSTPDDTPSIQVGRIITIHQPSLTHSGLKTFLAKQQCTSIP